MSVFGERVKYLLRQLGLTQSELASFAGTTDANISRYINSERMPNVEMAALIATALGTTADYLAGKTDDPAALPRNAISGVIDVPILGVVKAGLSGYAREELEGYQKVPENMLTGHHEDYFYLRVQGDSMAPSLAEGDLVLIHKQTSVDSGQLAVVIVDSEDGVIKRVFHSGSGADPARPDSYWIELKSENPYYPTRRFVGEDVMRINVVGRAVLSSRML